MSEMRCPHCEQSVRPTRHTPEECLNNMRQQRDEARENLGVAERANAMHIEALQTCRLERDEAREVSAGLLSHLEVAWAANRDMAQVIEAQRKEVAHAVKRFYPWLKKQASVDEEEG